MEILKSLLLALLLTVSSYCIAADPVDINFANKETLMAVKGVGEKRAEAIINYRTKYGPFSSIEELTEVEGIGQATVDANRDILIVTSQK